MGAFQELVWRSLRLFGKKSGLRKSGLRIPNFTAKIPRYVNNVNYLATIVLVVAIVYFGETGFCRLCPFGFIFGCSKGPGVLELAIFAFSLLTFALFYRPFCRFFCPYGLILRLLSKFSFQRQERRN